MGTRKKSLKIVLIILALNITGSSIAFIIGEISQSSKFTFQNLSTFQVYAIFLGAMLAFVVGGNFLIHKYYKNNHNNVLYRIKNENAEIFENLKLRQTWSFGIRINRADVVFVNEQIIVLIYNSVFCLRQAQPAILFYKEEPRDDTKGISTKCKIESVNYTNRGFEINTKSASLFGNFDLCFEFKVDLNANARISNFLDSHRLT